VPFEPGTLLIAEHFGNGSLFLALLLGQLRLVNCPIPLLNALSDLSHLSSDMKSTFPFFALSLGQLHRSPIVPCHW
jgi:hypothetical protein